MIKLVTLNETCGLKVMANDEQATICWDEQRFYRRFEQFFLSPRVKWSSTCINSQIILLYSTLTIREIHYGSMIARHFVI